MDLTSYEYYVHPSCVLRSVRTHFEVCPTYSILPDLLLSVFLPSSFRPTHLGIHPPFCSLPVKACKPSHCYFQVVCSSFDHVFHRVCVELYRIHSISILASFPILTAAIIGLPYANTVAPTQLHHSSSKEHWTFTIYQSVSTRHQQTATIR